MAISKRLLSAGLVTVSFTGFVMASQWGYAAEPPAYPMVATAEMMQLLRDEHDLVAGDDFGVNCRRNETGTGN